MDKLLKAIKKITYKHMLAVAFLFAIMYTGAVAFLPTIYNVGEYIKTTSPGIVAVRDMADNEYRNMLSFNNSNSLTDKGIYIDFNGLMARAMGQRFMNERIKLDNGHLTQIARKQDVSLAATQLTKLCNAQKENGRAFLFVVAPFQVPKYEDIMPAGYEDFVNDNADDLLELLRANEVPFIDLREEMKNEGISYSEAFFVTDHHWTPEMGFWAYAKIIDYLKREGVAPETSERFSDISEYDIEIKNDLFLGSSGKRTGRYFAGADDFSIISPKDSNWGNGITFSLPGTDFSVQGSFGDILFNRNRLNAEPNYFNANPYGLYGFGDAAEKHYSNSNAPADFNILTIGDSFALATFPYLSLNAGVMDHFDMRYYKNDFSEYYNDTLPDAIIILVTAHGVVSENTTYEFLP
ncbi:MAG: hypothetical protein FWH33_02170 [Oscillospiraceae bacterium]|nr:hypothetical protein [Oscillospiraceae bacterium]